MSSFSLDVTDETSSGSSDQRINPPSTTKSEPVQNADLSEARNAASSATSSGVPTRPSGCAAPKRAKTVSVGSSGAKCAADEALDLLRPSAQGLSAAVAILTARICARVHLVLGRDPSEPFSLEKGRHLVVDRGRAEHDGAASPVEDGALGGAMKVRGHLDRAERVE